MEVLEKSNMTIYHWMPVRQKSSDDGKFEGWCVLDIEGLRRSADQAAQIRGCHAVHLFSRSMVRGTGAEISAGIRSWKGTMRGVQTHRKDNRAQSNRVGWMCWM